MNKQEVIRQLRQVGYRWTAQRSLLLEAIWTFEDHFTVEMVRAALPPEAGSVDTSTIYRTLDLLCQLGVLHSLVGPVPTEYERRCEAHHHLVCRACGTVTAIDDYHLDGLVAHLREEHNFVADLAHLAIPGRCRACEAVTPEEDP